MINLQFQLLRCEILLLFFILTWQQIGYFWGFNCSDIRIFTESCMCKSACFDRSEVFWCPGGVETEMSSCWHVGRSGFRYLLSVTSVGSCFVTTGWVYQRLHVGRCRSLTDRWREWRQSFFRPWSNNKISHFWVRLQSHFELLKCLFCWETTRKYASVGNWSGNTGLVHYTLKLKRLAE